MTEGASRRPTLLVRPHEGRPTLRIAYLFSGVQRNTSIAQHLKGMCEKAGIGLDVEEIDIQVGGAAHDLLDKEKQEELMGRIEAGEYDLLILSPPCGTWSRAKWSNHAEPSPVRDRQHPWGFASLLRLSSPLPQRSWCCLLS